MELIEGPRISPVDPTPFVTYLSEEDTTPTDAELVEELPEYEMPPALKAYAEGKPLEKPLRRGVGYLRAEAATESETSAEASDFGAGLETDPPSDEQKHATADADKVTIDSSDTSTVQSQDPVESDAAPADSPSGEAEATPNRSRGGKRRRGRRRRGRSRGSDAATGRSPTDASAVSSQATRQSPSNGDVEPVAGAKADSRDQGKEGDGNRPRRRRNRRRRRGKKSQAGDGNASQGE